MAEWDGRGLVSSAWLADNLGDPDLRVFDVTVHLRPAPTGPYQIESGRADYEAAHIPGAAFLDRRRELCPTRTPRRLHHARTSIDLPARWGPPACGAAARVVAYTTTTPMWATRLWWMLRVCGFDERRGARWRLRQMDGGGPRCGSR